jgi:hypothetical protein
MKPDDEMLKRFLETDIPYRTQAIDGLQWYTERAQRGMGISAESLKVQLDGFELPTQAFLNGVFEMGLGSLRAVCEFLGFKVSKDRGLISARQGRKDDAVVEDFPGGTLVTPDLARLAGVGTPDETDAALIYALRLANKAVAHLTYGPLGVDAEKLVLACRSVRALTIRYLYEGRSAYVDAYPYPARVAELASDLETRAAKQNWEPSGEVEPLTP